MRQVVVEYPKTEVDARDRVAALRSCFQVNQDYKELKHRALEDILPSVSISSYGSHDTIPPNNAEKKPLVESMER